jgi:hypothetical protein
VYLRARYYDPSTGRFLSRDRYPMRAADTQTVSRYVYVKNNPTNYVDPSGEVSITAGIASFLLKGASTLSTSALLPALIKANRVYSIKKTNQDPFLHPEFVGGPDTINDAWRHSYTAKQVTQEAGWGAAFAAGIANELWAVHKPDWRLADTLMDIHNNNVGIVAGILGSSIDDRFLMMLDEGRRQREYLRTQGQ